MMPLAPVITAVAAVVFVSCLLVLASRQQRSEATSGRHSQAVSSYVGKHWREPKQPPSPVLSHALKTVGTHGLGFSRESEAAWPVSTTRPRLCAPHPVGPYGVGARLDIP
ncbi:hypothetical protein SAMN04487818_11175 [Actinokineospora terrae]|uniref:Uncharacterized protein n=1 Tax=Actinokineospora terrae TaxID=155974 RepID=A0A1H9WQU6_9PSEU|nr:hypothetical protein SAMN04487818_11175 [Actinokineospora terrae]